MIYQPKRTLLVAGGITAAAAVGLAAYAFKTQRDGYENQLGDFRRQLSEKNERIDELKLQVKTLSQSRVTTGGTQPPPSYRPLPPTPPTETRPPATSTEPPPPTGGAPVTDGDIANLTGLLRAGADTAARHDACRKLLEILKTRPDDPLVLSPLQTAVLSDSSDQIRGDILAAFVEHTREDTFELLLQQIKLETSPKVRERICGELARLADAGYVGILKQSRKEPLPDGDLKPLAARRRNQVRILLSDQVALEADDGVRRKIQLTLTALEKP
jgi:hypothetical protein